MVQRRWNGWWNCGPWDNLWFSYKLNRCSLNSSSLSFSENWNELPELFERSNRIWMGRRKPNISGHPVWLQEEFFNPPMQSRQFFIGSWKFKYIFNFFFSSLKIRALYFPVSLLLVSWWGWVKSTVRSQKSPPEISLILRSRLLNFNFKTEHGLRGKLGYLLAFLLQCYL